MPVPLPLSRNVTPDGSEPETASAGVGLPVVVTVNVPGLPTVKVVVAALVIVGPALTVSVKFWIAAGLVPVAVKVSAYVPSVPAAGVPLNVAVPSPLSANVTPVGRAAPVRTMAGAGNPVVVTVNVPACRR